MATPTLRSPLSPNVTTATPSTSAYVQSRNSKCCDQELIRARPNFIDVLTILVGPEASPKTFVVPQDQIAARSRFISAACNKGWIEGQQKVIRLPVEMPDMYRVYINWVHTGEIDFVDLELSDNPPYSELIALYLIANRMGPVDCCFASCPTSRDCRISD
jgi:hypothetical protein